MVETPDLERRRLLGLQGVPSCLERRRCASPGERHWWAGRPAAR